MDELVLELGRIVSELGFDYCSYVLKMPEIVPLPPVTWASTYPTPWLDHYFSHGYLHVDPLLSRLEDKFLPVVWKADPGQESPEFWEEADAHGIRHGWAINSYGKMGVTGTLSLARSDEPVASTELGHNEMKLTWLAQMAQGFVSSAALEKLATSTTAELTPRECEVLKWSAAGKTADEIGIILNVTARTVNFHIARCIAKLDVVNKTQAVAKALLLGMLN
jgi:LuxR family transcriptional regulator, quorum-sensing system regulator SolR